MCEEYLAQPFSILMPLKFGKQGEFAAGIYPSWKTVYGILMERNQRASLFYNFFTIFVKSWWFIFLTNSCHWDHQKFSTVAVSTDPVSPPTLKHLWERSLFMTGGVEEFDRRSKSSEIMKWCCRRRYLYLRYIWIRIDLPLSTLYCFIQFKPLFT